MKIAGIPIIVSPYVPKLELFEEAYTRPLIVKLLHGRTVDIRTWEEDQVFLLGGDYWASPESVAVIRRTLA